MQSLVDPAPPTGSREKHDPHYMTTQSNFEHQANLNLSGTFDTTHASPQSFAGVRLVGKHEAAAILGVSTETLKRYRLQKDSTLIKGIHYFVWNSRVVRYNPVLLADWGMNRDTPQAHQKAIEVFLASLPSNQAKQRGRRAG